MKILVMLFSLLSFTFISGCSLSTVDAGEEGVITYQPYFFGSGGVDSEPIAAGSAWVAISTSVDRYNVKPVKHKESFIDLTASDNVAIDFDVYLTLKIKKGKSPTIHEFSGRQWYDNKIKDTFRAFVRNEARTRSSIELRTDESVITGSQGIIKQLIIDYVESIDLPVEVVKVNIGKVVPPLEVLAEAAQTAAQKQRKLTQDQRKLAEDARADAEKATALADKSYSNEFNMTTDQFLRNKELDVMSKAIAGGTVSLIMNASSAAPIFNVNSE